MIFLIKNKITKKTI